MGGSSVDSAVLALLRKEIDLLEDIKLVLYGGSVDENRKSIGQMAVSQNTVISFDDTNYRKLVSNWGDGYCNNFTVDNDNDRLIFVGDTQKFLFNGSCEYSTNKACDATLALYKNGSLVTGAETLHTFSNTAKVGSVGICRALELTTGDYLEVWVKVSDADADLTFNSLAIVFWGEF